MIHWIVFRRENNNIIQLSRSFHDSDFLSTKSKYVEFWCSLIIIHKINQEQRIAIRKSAVNDCGLALAKPLVKSNYLKHKKANFTVLCWSTFCQFIFSKFDQKTSFWYWKCCKLRNCALSRGRVLIECFEMIFVFQHKK